MTWLVFGVSCLLVLAGAVSIISGAPIIQLERGWAEVISGTVAVSSGGVVFALALVLVRLEGLRDALAARTGSERDASAATAEVPATLPAPVAAMGPPVPDAEVKPSPEPAPTVESRATEAEHALWKRIRRPTDGNDTERLSQAGFPDRIVPDDTPPAGQPPSSPPVIVPSHAAPTPRTTEPEPETPAEAGQIGWLERSLTRSRSRITQPGMAVPEPSLPPLFGDAAPDRPGRIEPSPSPPTPQNIAEGATPGAPAVTLEPDPTPDALAERGDGVTVIGRYQAGSSSYVMYSDGTIEVETEDGQVHRFGSMDELKSYIASQDTPAG